MTLRKVAVKGAETEYEPMNVKWIFELVILLVLVGIGTGAYSLFSELNRRCDVRHETRIWRKAGFISVALRHYHAKHGAFPPPYVSDQNGLPLYSWRVLLLPFLGEDDLYNRFDLSKPWNAPENIGLVQEIPQWYRDDDVQAKTGVTRFVAVTGPDTIWTLDGSVSTEQYPKADFVIAAIYSHQTTRIWSAPEDIGVSDTQELIKNLAWSAEFRPRSSGIVSVRAAMPRIIRFPISIQDFRRDLSPVDVEP